MPEFRQYHPDKLVAAHWGLIAQCQVPGSNVVVEGELRHVRLIVAGEYGIRIGNVDFILYSDQVLGILE